MKSLIIFSVLAITGFLSVDANATDIPKWKAKGYVEASLFPVNDEYGIYSTLEGYVQVHPPKDLDRWFVFVNPTLSFTRDLNKRIRHDRSYITSLNLGGFAYLSEVKLGVGYQISNELDARIIYYNLREANGYEGDFTGIQIRWTFGK